MIFVMLHGKAEKYAWPRWESNLRPLESSLHDVNTQLDIGT